VFHGSHISLIFGLITATLVTSKVYGEIGFRGFWCWIAADPTAAEMVYLYGPMAVIALAAVVCWVKIVLSARAMRLDTVNQFYAVLTRHLVMAAVFLLIFVAMFWHRVYNAVAKTDTYGLAMGHIVGLSLIGTTLFAIFCTSKNNVVLWADLFRRICNKNEYETLN